MSRRIAAPSYLGRRGWRRRAPGGITSGHGQRVDRDGCAAGLRRFPGQLQGGRARRACKPRGPGGPRWCSGCSCRACRVVSVRFQLAGACQISHSGCTTKL